METDDGEDSDSSKAASSVSVRSPEAKKSKITCEASLKQSSQKLQASSNETMNALIRELEKLDFNSRTSVDFKELTPRQFEVPKKRPRLNERASIHKYKSIWTEKSHKGTNTESNLNVPSLEEARTALEPNIIVVSNSTSCSSSLPEFKKSLSNVTSIASPSFIASTLDAGNFVSYTVGMATTRTNSNSSVEDFEQPLKTIEKLKLRKIKRVVSTLASGIFKPKEGVAEVNLEGGDVNMNNFRDLAGGIRETGGGDDAGVNSPGRTHSDVFLERRPQNTQLKFYNVNKTPTGSKGVKEEASLPSPGDSEDVQPRKCCDFSWCVDFMFPKRAQHYF